MTTAMTVEQAAARVSELLELRARIDDELARLVGIPEPRIRRSRLTVPNCGTETGYQRHRHRGETCDECKAAHAEHTRRAYQLAAARKIVEKAS